jgi:hypothetical protein
MAKARLAESMAFIAVIPEANRRIYEGPGAKELFDLLERRKAEIEAVIRTVPGLVSHTLVRTAVGGTVTVCQNRAGVDQSTQIAKE